MRRSLFISEQLPVDSMHYKIGQIREISMGIPQLSRFWAIKKDPLRREGLGRM
jgi:hypothetical protein